MNSTDSRNYNNSGPSTIKGANASSVADNVSANVIDQSQSRIKVNLSQNDDDTLGMTGMDEEPQMIQPKPTLNNAGMEPSAAAGFRSHDSTPHGSAGMSPAPMQEMN